MTRPRTSGFTLVRNAVKLDYPFREAVLSILPLCDELVINVGDSDDGTRELCERLVLESEGRIRLVHSVWTREAQSGGYQLKAQSDRALAECRGDWCVYIQADEVLHEADRGALREAMARADRDPEVDGLLFDYLHFYGNYSYVITGRNWYRREVRAFKNGRGIQAYRDAQGFRRNDQKLKVIGSGARVFHYGHVRSAVGFRRKAEEMSQWWGEAPETRDERLRPYRHVGLKRFPASHPAVMAERLARNADYFDPMQCPRKWNKDEVKNLLTLAWESVFPFRLGEFKNYELVRC